VKSETSKLETNLPFLSVTVTGRTTRLTCFDMTYGSDLPCACKADAAAEEPWSPADKKRSATQVRAFQREVDARRIRSSISLL